MHQHKSKFFVVSEVFFFSSRRRHTRFDCDWSSDVCSSDLVAAVVGLGEADDDRLVEEEQPEEAQPGEDDEPAEQRGLGEDVDDAGDQPDERGRSEEHTSELQSQSNLVCRLLLEKKKTKKIK